MPYPGGATFDFPGQGVGRVGESGRVCEASKGQFLMHKESGFLCRKRKGWQRPGYVKNTSGPGRVRRGMKEARASRRSNGVRVARGENTPQHIIACQGAAVKGNIPRGVSGGGRGSGGEMSANEQKQMRKTREGEQRQVRDARVAEWVKKVSQD